MTEGVKSRIVLFFEAHKGKEPSKTTMDPQRKSRKSKSDKKKKSGVRTKFLIESLRNDYYELREENERLRELVSANIPNADAILSTCFDLNNKAQAGDIDELAGKMSGTGLTDDEEDDDF